MTAEQVALLRDTALKDSGDGTPVAYTLSVLFNNEVTFRNTDDFVIWDDANELVHAIKINMDGPRQSAVAPYRIATGFFGNIQFMEGIYTMANFEKAIDELFVKPGLISDEKKEFIMKWANGIRNNISMPSNPGPYYPTVPMVPGRPPKPDVRPGDGIWHGAPIDMRTKENMIISKVDPVINGMNGYERCRPLEYRVVFTDPSGFPAQFKQMIEAIPEKDLFWASVGNGHRYAEYNLKIQMTIDNFEDGVAQLLPEKPGLSVHLDLNIEAYGVRVKYCFIMVYTTDITSEENWAEEASKAITSAFTALPGNNEAVTNCSVYGKTVSLTIKDSNTDLGLTDMMQGIEGFQSATYKCGTKKFMLTAGGNTTSFKGGIKSTMPTENNQTQEANLEVRSATGTTLTYTLKVKYYNEEKMAIEVDGKKYEDLNAAIDAAASGGTVTLIKDVTGVNALVRILKPVTIDLNGHSVTGSTTHMFVATGMAPEQIVTIKNGTINNTDENSQTTVVAQKANVIMENVNIVSAGVFGAEAGVGADGYWGRMELKNCNIKAKNAVSVFGPHTQYVADGYTHPVSIMRIDGQCVLEGTSEYGVMCNGAAHDVQVIIEDGAQIKSPQWGIYAPADGTYTIGAAKITAGKTGVEFRAGTAELTGTEIAANSETFNVKPNGNGTTTTGAGIAVAQHTTKIPVSITMNGVKVNSTQYAIYESNPQQNPNIAGTVTLAVKSGEYKATGGKDVIYSEDCTKFVAAGVTSNKEIGATYLKDNTECTQSGDVWTVVEVSPAEVAENTVDNIIENVTGIVIVPEEGQNNVYSITTDDGSISDSGLFDQLAAVEGMQKITVTDGTNTTEYTAGGDLAAFKAAVDAMVPTTSTAGEVTLTMTVEM